MLASRTAQAVFKGPSPPAAAQGRCDIFCLRHTGRQLEKLGGLKLCQAAMIMCTERVRSIRWFQMQEKEEKPGAGQVQEPTAAAGRAAGQTGAVQRVPGPRDQCHGLRLLCGAAGAAPEIRGPRPPGQHLQDQVRSGFQSHFQTRGPQSGRLPWQSCCAGCAQLPISMLALLLDGPSGSYNELRGQQIRAIRITSLRDRPAPAIPVNAW